MNTIINLEDRQGTYVVRDAFLGKEKCRGTYQDCVNWLMDRIVPIGDRRIFRQWTEDNIDYYDIGTVYIVRKVGG